MRQIIQQGNDYIVAFDYSPAIISDIKLIPGRRFDSASKCWVVPVGSKKYLDTLAARHNFNFAGVDTPPIFKNFSYEVPAMPKLKEDIPLKRDLFPFQKEGVQYILDQKRVIVGDQPGLGKAQPLTAKIATPNGWMSMGEMLIGQKVFGKDGRIYEVRGVYPQGTRSVYRVTFNDGFSTECDIEHLWCVRDVNRRRRNGPWAVKSLGELLERGLSYTLTGAREKSGRRAVLKWEIPLTESVQYPSKEFVIHPYVMGVLLGDGSLCGKGICISIPDSEEETVGRIKALLPSNLKLKVNRHPACPQYFITQTGTTHKNPFSAEIERLGLNVKGKNKFIPVEYLTASVEQREELLKGLMDSDGSAKKNRITFHSCSRGLVDGVAELIQSLGGQVIVREYDRSREDKGIEWQVNVRIGHCPFKIQRKADQWGAAMRHYASRRIRSVEYVREDKVQCIEVSAPDNLYLTDNYTVTHNTGQAIAALIASGAFPALIICPSSLKENWRREVELWTSKTAMILNDSIRSTWPYFFEAKLADIFIVNYESLKKYFVAEIKQPIGPDGKKVPLKLNHVKFSSKINLLKSVVVDESHRCLAYDNKILTNRGWIKIGDIVEKNMRDLLVASYNLSENMITFEQIVSVLKNDRNGRQLRKINAGGSCVTATEDHKLYVDGCGWKEALSIQSGEGLYCLRKEFSNQKFGEDNCNILREELLFHAHQLNTGDSCQNGQEQKETQADEGVSMVRDRICTDPQSLHRGEGPLLLPKLFGKMAGSPTGNNCKKQIGCKAREITDLGHRANEKFCVAGNAIETHDREQSYEKDRISCQNDAFDARKTVYSPRREWPHLKRAANFVRCIEVVGRFFGICHKHKICSAFIRATGKMLQGGYCDSRDEDRDRGGWALSQDEKGHRVRHQEKRDIECVRVDSNTRFQPRRFGKPFFGSRRNRFVYDIEVENNHNYFANGILVHNCKEIKTLQTKLTKGICSGKEYIFLLTGTPVVNKPKDLVSQLGILDRLKDLGGYQNFQKWFCEADDRWRELNVLLRRNCFYRREKSDVLKDLPPKMRQSVLCDISTRREYNDALQDLADYLKRYKQATDEQIQRSLRGEIMVRIGVLKNVSARGKITDVVDYVSDVVDAGEKIILFTHLREVQQQLKTFFPAAVTIFGDDDMATRQRNVDAFQNDPRVQVIICSIKAAGVGLTLTASSRVAFVELPWHPADCEQCEDRAHRIGQTDSVQCIYFLGKNTIDEDIYRLIAEKRDMSRQITGAREEVEESIVNGVINLLAKNA